MLFCRNDELYVSQEGQTGFSICQLQDNPLTSSDEQHLDTVSYLKSPSPAPFAGSSVDSAEDRSLYNREDKIPKKVVKNMHLYTSNHSDRQ